MPPRHPLVWVHVQGAWRKGSVSAWITPGHGTGWECVIVAEPTPGDPPWQGRYVYDPQTFARGMTTIRPLYDPPDDPARAAGSRVSHEGTGSAGRSTVDIHSFRFCPPLASSLEKKLRPR